MAGRAACYPLPERIRAAVILLDGDRVCLIRRERAGSTYYLFPGGGVEDGETPELAAIREAREELGLEVDLTRLVAEFRHGTEHQLYYMARSTGGEFGAGVGEELSSTADTTRGTYKPVWMPLKQAVTLDTRPIELCRELLLHGARLRRLPLQPDKVD